MSEKRQALCSTRLPSAACKHNALSHSPIHTQNYIVQLVWVEGRSEYQQNDDEPLTRLEMYPHSTMFSWTSFAVLSALY